MAPDLTDIVNLVDGKPALSRATLPDLKEEIVLREIPLGLLVSTQGSLHIIGERCWRLRGSGPQLEAISVEPPWQFDDGSGQTVVDTETGARFKSFGPKPAAPGHDPYAARRVFPSRIYGLLVSAAIDRTSAEAGQAVSVEHSGRVAAACRRRLSSVHRFEAG